MTSRVPSPTPVVPSTQDAELRTAGTQWGYATTTSGPDLGTVAPNLGADDDASAGPIWAPSPCRRCHSDVRKNYCLEHSSGFLTEESSACHLAVAMLDAWRPHAVAPTKQSRKASFVEAWVGTLVGMAVSLVLQYTVLPAYGMPAIGLAGNLQILGIFTLASVARGYLVRRLFNHLA